MADHRILIVDDEPALSQVLQRVLSREYSNVVALTSAHAALRLLDEGRRFDAILCDFSMPEMNGEDFQQRLEPRLRDRVIFLVGGALTTKDQAFLALTQNLRVTKPFSMAAVSVLVKRVIAARDQIDTEPPPARDSPST